TLSIPSVLAMFYCIFKLKVNFSLNVKRSCYREIISLTTWNSFGTLSYVLMTQGGTILINSFYGVALNAARAASLQVQSALLQVSNSAQAAVNPRIVKLYSAGEIVEFSRLLFRSTKYIYLLLLLFSVPIFVNSDELVSLWLKNAPNFTSEFVRYIVLINLVNSISFGIMAGVQATGNIKNYQLI
ncbi:lipopolysaccharide biosynthesis protein, partial [Vibrio parahaemolyticus]